uniref:Uncharacterized protein n=1 Tax=Rhizophora mucronata TaxID=61149 RepID=A0A2P2R3W8_RHIMU
MSRKYFQKNQAGINYFSHYQHFLYHHNSQSYIVTFFIKQHNINVVGIDAFYQVSGTKSS